MEIRCKACNVPISVNTLLIDDELCVVCLEIANSAFEETLTPELRFFYKHKIKKEPSHD